MKKKKLLAVLVALLLIIGAGVYTYARYTYSKTGNGKIDVAKWAVALKNGDTEVADEFELTLVPTTNENVVNNKIAPGRSATATLTLYLAGTEVATDYEVDLSGATTDLPKGMSITGVTADGTDLTGTDGKYTGKVALNGDKTAIADDEVTLVITAEWVNDEKNNTDDTTFGTNGGTLTIPVTVTAKQHIGA